MFHSIGNVDNPLLVHHIVGVFMKILDKHTMDSGEPRTTFLYVKNTIPRAACFEPEDALKLLTNCGDFIFSLGKIVGVELKWWKELLENGVGFSLMG